MKICLLSIRTWDSATRICCEADIILTFNLKDFPQDSLKPHGIEAQHPDDFLAQQLDLVPDIVCAAAKRQRQSLKKPPMSVDGYLASLGRQGLAQTVLRLREYAELL